MDVDIEKSLSEEQARQLVSKAPQEKQELLVIFLQALYRAYSDLYFTYMEINPLGVCVCVCVLCAHVNTICFFFSFEEWSSLHVRFSSKVGPNCRVHL